MVYSQKDLKAFKVVLTKQVLIVSWNYVFSVASVTNAKRQVGV